MNNLLLSQEEESVRNYLVNHLKSVRRGADFFVNNRDLSRACGLGLDMSNAAHRDKIGYILDNVSRFEYAESRPLLSAVVVTATHEQSVGFYKLCEELGLGKRAILKDSFYGIEEANRCVEYWKEQA